MTNPDSEEEDACAAAQAIPSEEEDDCPIELRSTPVTATTYEGTATTTTVSVRPLVARPTSNEAQEASRGKHHALVWEAVSHNAQGRAWQWRAWHDGICVGVITWSRVLRQYCAAAMAKRIGTFHGQKIAWSATADQSVPPSISAINAVSYTVVDLMASGSAVEADQEALNELGDGPGVEVAQEASVALLAAHNVRYEVDETDESAVMRANAAVQQAIDACEAAHIAVAQARKSVEQRSEEAQQVIAAAQTQIATFNEGGERKLN